jgi:NADH:ubiquinone oxidoreductase subunit 6 (subunit J)
MRLDPRSSKDFLAGLLFALIGGSALVGAFAYPLGSAMRMGPGYFPALLGAILVLFGLVIMARGIRSGEPVSGPWGWKPLAWAVLSMLLFGFLVTRLGLVPALVAMLVTATLAGREFRWRETLVLAATLTAFAVALFVYGLKIPFRLFIGW